MFTQKFSVALLALALSQPVAASANEMVVIVSARNPAGAMRAEQVASIFLAQNGRFPDGTEAAAIDQPVGSAQRDEFYSKVASKSPALVKAYWTKMVFTGRGQPPKEANNSAAVRKLVSDNPGLIGYIDKAFLDTSVKPVMFVP
jgi:ABC-type phosphate transport system substrate-binding protein